MAGPDEEQTQGSPEGGHGSSHPGATILPAGFALGVALLLIGLVANWIVFGIGAAIALVFGLFWIIDAAAGGRRRRPAAPTMTPEGAVAAREAAAEEVERYPRNVFLERATLGLGALIGVAVTAPVIGFAIAPTFIDQGDDAVDLGPLENFPEGQYQVATFVSRPLEGEVSKRTAFIRNNGVLDGLPSFTIMSNTCVHLGCPVQPGGPTDLEAANEFEAEGNPVRLVPSQPSNFVCPCHGGSYDTEGNAVAGPPVRALDRYQYAIVEGRLVLGERYSVGEVEGTGKDATIIAYTRKDPGQHVDGPTDWMYPVSPRGA